MITQSEFIRQVNSHLICNFEPIVHMIVIYISSSPLIYKLFFFQLLHISRPKFYTVQDDCQYQKCTGLVHSSSSSKSKKLKCPKQYVPSTCGTGNRRQKNVAFHQKKERNVLPRNVAIVKNYPNDSPAMLEKLEEMRRLLTNVRRHSTWRRYTHIHRDQR